MLSRSQEEMAMYRHDIRHHFVMLIEYLKNDNPQKALEYINSVYNDIEKLTPKKYCKNNSINLIFSYFENISSKAGIKFTAEVNIFQDISFPETEICTLLSNGIENAVQACARCKDQEKWICIVLKAYKEKLLISITNTYSAEVIMKDGIPITHNPSHGFGSKSICMIVKRHGGMYSFEPKDGIFTLRIVMPYDNI